MTDPKPWVARTWAGTRTIAEERYAEAWEAQAALTSWMVPGGANVRVSIDYEPRATDHPAEVQK